MPTAFTEHGVPIGGKPLAARCYTGMAGGDGQWREMFLLPEKTLLYLTGLFGHDCSLGCSCVAVTWRELVRSLGREPSLELCSTIRLPLTI